MSARVPCPGLLETLGIRNGEACIRGKGVATRVLFGTWMAGDSVARVANWYGVTIEEVEHSIRYESARRRRHKWAREWRALQAHPAAAADAEKEQP
jgi:uncharacterized protein (DUF433 family)